jgi:hypothetical protein
VLPVWYSLREFLGSLLHAKNFAILTAVWLMLLAGAVLSAAASDTQSVCWPNDITEQNYFICLHLQQSMNQL